ncbi:MAG: diacylglycerol kinase [Deltaproteobacteria bacterium]|nr:diacylglycerol kinase [Deltaproteobacteria bacterium]
MNTPKKAGLITERMDNRKEVVKPKNWLEALNCAIEGVIYAFRTQRHVRYHYVIATVALLLSLYLRLPVFEFVLFAMAVVILLFAEMMNTAIEEAVNLIEEKHHLFAKNAKDVAAGAVLIAAFGVLIMLYMIFSKYLYAPMGAYLREAKLFAGHIAVIALLLVLIAVIFIKATVGKGTPLHGGMPSGHAAVSFSIATAITLLTMEPMVAILAFIMASLASHSRLIANIHTRFEIVMGAVLGLGLTLLIFEIFTRAVR